MKIGRGASANQLTDFILVVANQFIPQRTLTERKSTHPWMNDRVIDLVRQKRDAEGTEREEECRTNCSGSILEEHTKFVARVRAALQEIQRGKKWWWSTSRRLLRKKCVVSSIPALRASDGKWVHEVKSQSFRNYLIRKV